MNWRAVLPWLVIAALAVITVLLLCQRGPVVPPAVAVKVDTLWRVVDGDTSYKVEYRIDPAASKELTRLRNELVRRQNLIERLTGYLSDMDEENRYLADSLSRLVLDSVRGIVRVQRGPAGIAVVSYQGGLVQTWRLPLWRQRWTLLAGQDKPAVKTSRFPVDLGLAAVVGMLTDPSKWSPSPTAWLGLAITHEQMTATVGPYYDGQLKLRGEVRLDWRW